jgi:hypothetical protein
MNAKLEELHNNIAERWTESIESLNTKQESTTWTNLEEIKRAIEPFLGTTLNHAHFPTGGGLDFLRLIPSRETDCLEAATSERAASVFKAEKLTLEHFPKRPQESFLLLELAPLAPSGVYEHDIKGHEELLDVPGQGYMERYIWDQGYLNHDERGHEIPIPQDAKLISRWLEGKILIVAKGSIWNGTPAKYNGEHNRMSAAQIREQIERVITQL